MDDSTDVFHVMRTMRPMRRYTDEPVSDAVLEEILDAACCAPNSLNSQPYRFLVIRDATTKILFGERYDAAMQERFAPLVPAPDDNSRRARNIRTAMKLGDEIRRVPVLLLVLGERDWPFVVPPEERVGVAPPSYGSVYPAVQNILLGCRARGLGTVLTTMHQLFEDELCEHLGIPSDWGIVAALPIGYPRGNFGPVGREPSSTLTFNDRWGNPFNTTHTEPA